MIYKLYIYEHGSWQDTCERGTKPGLLAMMADCPKLYSGVQHRFVKCKNQSPIDRQTELWDLLNGYVRE